MDIWETDAALLGSDEELELQVEGWMPFGAAAVVTGRDLMTLIIYRRKNVSDKDAPNESKET